jgi:hypothetical protein
LIARDVVHRGLFQRPARGATVPIVIISPRISPRRGARRLLAAVLWLGVGLSAGCSLIVEQRSRQCDTDAQCSAFKDAQCDVKRGVCVAREGPGCVDPTGCYACPPTSTRQFQTACTGAACVPYDNTALKALLSPDGGLPPVP